MTMPSERSRAMVQVRDFLYSLLDPKQTPRVPLEVRQRAHDLLRHYPTQYDIVLLSEMAPELLKVKHDGQ